MEDIRRKAVNLICKYYEFDAAKIAAAMSAEQRLDNSALINLIEEMIADLRDLQRQLEQPTQERIITPRKASEKKKKPLGRRPNPDRAQQKRNDYIAKRRSQLRHDGYHIERNSMVAYWDEKTHRRKKTESSNIFGFIFKPLYPLKKNL